MALGCSGPAATTSPTPTTVTEPPTAADPEPVAVETPPPVPPAPMTDEDLRAIEPSPVVRGTPSSQAAIAATANEDGMRLMLAQSYAEASTKFRDALARVPDGAYAYNLCSSLYQQGQFTKALAACDAVTKLSPSAALEARASRMIRRIKDEARAQNLVVP